MRLLKQNKLGAGKACVYAHESTMQRQEEEIYRQMAAPFTYAANYVANTASHVASEMANVNVNTAVTVGVAFVEGTIGANKTTMGPKGLMGGVTESARALAIDRVEHCAQCHNLKGN